MNPFIESSYAAARKALEQARIAQGNALLFGLDVYKGGRLGREARHQRQFWENRRARWILEALRIRRNIRQLREELRAA